MLTFILLLALHKPLRHKTTHPLTVNWSKSSIIDLGDAPPFYICPIHGPIQINFSHEMSENIPVVMQMQDGCQLGPYCFKCLIELTNKMPKLERADGEIE